MTGSLLLVLALITAPAASAAPSCSSAMSVRELSEHLDAFDAAIADFELDAATSQLKTTHASMLCLDTLVPPESLGRLARQLALTFFFDQDADATRRWGLLQRYAEPDLPWGSDFGADHPFREALEAAEDPVQGGPDDRSFAPPKKGGIFVNGRPMAEPVYYAEVPAFVQVADKKGVITHQYWQDGAAFHDAVLGPMSGPIAPPKWWSGPTAAPSGDAVAVVDIEPEPEPQPQPEIEPEPEAAAATTRPVISRLSAAPEGYVDPFEDARLRAIARETTVREEADRTITSEVTTFAVVAGADTAVLQRDFAEFIAYQPAYKRDAAIEAGVADKGYLASWKKGQPPEPDAPVVGVPFDVAVAYCDQWSQGLSAAAFDVPQRVAEWRLGDLDAPMRKAVDGTVTVWEQDTGKTEPQTGFRCVD